MPANEKLHMYADQLSDELADAAVKMIEGYLHAIDEALDDAYCLKLFEQARNDTENEFEDFDVFAKRIRAGWE